ncbi:hypothetical protein NE857_09135 [Nocardiopsis exhalans]|uniref:Uncharacterized protein n=1 Tax=Nocardiopsis exhalans TaxID=163604 RepID=A0ABY5DEF1_9ACTN|nr:hypothetical protein [Nocardiopsis exhalans]USY21745.1 hypothetical protein NE857_09135 [Nocardiopsis exhalans]
MVLADFYRDQIGPLELLEYIDGLPAHSRLAAEQAEDDDLADQVVAQGDLPAQAPPPVTDLTPEARRLDAVLDRLGEVLAAIIAAAGQTPPRIPPAPRPNTAFDRARKRASVHRHSDLLARIAERRRTLAERRRTSGPPS